MASNQYRYYIQTKDRMEGPFSLADLRKKNINRDTMVWSEEQGDWRKAGTMRELRKNLLNPLPVKQGWLDRIRAVFSGSKQDPQA